MTPPRLLGTGNCADVVPFETFVKSSNERGSSPLPPGHSGGVPSCPVMLGDALPSCLGLSPREDDALGTALSSARGLQALLGETRGSSEGLVPARDPDPMALFPSPYGASAQHKTSPSRQVLPSTSLLPPWKYREATWEAFPFAIPKGEKFGSLKSVNLLEAGAL